MIQKSRRRQPSRTQPVKLYKVIALTFLIVTIILFAVIVLISSKRATINIVTTTTPVDIKTNLTIGGTDSVKSVSGRVEQLTVHMDQRFEPSGTKQESGVATGQVTIKNDRAVPQSLVATTRLITPDGILFRLKENVRVPANGSVEAEVYADQEGRTGNIGPSTFTIPGLSADLRTQVYAESRSQMTGGVKNIGVISDSDIEKASKIMLQQLVEKGRTELGNKYPDMEVLYTSSGDEIAADATVGTEVSEFILSATTTILGIFYNQAELKQIASNLLMQKAEGENESIKPGDVDPTVALLEYHEENGTVDVEVVYSGVATLNLESAELAKEAFYGKTRDDVRRQLLRLDHVKSVDVTFSPAWVRKVPHVEDHVTVVIKSN